MALSFLRPNLVARYVKNQLYHNKRNAGYVVLIPEIGEDADRSTLLLENGLPEFNDFTIEKCISIITQQTLEYETGVKEVEQVSNSCKNAFEEIFKPLEKLDTQLELTWGMAKTLYLGNSSLMPTQSYIKIHERALKARSAKFNSVPIFKAAVEEKNRHKDLHDEEQRLLDKYILEGKLNGLEVSDLNKSRLNDILKDLRTNRTIFRDKVNVATKLFSHVIEDEHVVKSLPKSLLAAMSVSNQPLKGPWKLTLQPHIYEPFMQHCPDSNYRWNAWQAYTQRCSGYGSKDLDTSVHLEKIRKLRYEQATILGFDNFVEMSMETKMAKSVENVYKMLDSLLEVARPVQDLNMKSLQTFAQECGFNSKLQHWDIPFWQTKQKWFLYKFDDEKIREYFPLQKVLSSLFNLCGHLFNIQIVEKPNTHTWHKDVKFYEIYEDSSNNPIAGFYLDPYAREKEKIRVYDDAGWHVAIRNKCTLTASTPLSALIFNFQVPGEDQQSLLNFDEVNSLFFRFGHSLRHLLTRANYFEVAGLSNVEWDAAEVCGHVMTEWLYDPDTIRAISSHYRTHNPLSDDTIQNLQKSRCHMSGYSLCNELYLSRLDLEMHSKKDFWRKIVLDLWPKYHSIEYHREDSHPLAFTKVISEEWGGAYYCRLWSKIIAADIYSAFEEAKTGDKDYIAVCKRYKDTFLALGGSCHPSEVFRRFRGRDPSPRALMHNLGLVRKDED